MDIAGILSYKFPGTTWSVGEDYSSLKWPEQTTPKPTLEELTAFNIEYENYATLNLYKYQIKNHLDDKAAEKNYESALSCISYANSTNTAWQAEALAFNAWRDGVYAYLIDIETKVQAGQMAIPSYNDLLLGLPTLTWPQ